MVHNGLTIGIPVYNEEGLIERAIRSAIGQCERLIVSDNASSDGTETICRRLCEEFPEIDYVRQPENIGAVGNWTALLERADTPYFMYLGSHDHLDAGYVQRVLPALNAPDVAAAFGELLYEYGSKAAPDTTLNEWTGGAAAIGRDRLTAMLYSRVPVVWAMYGIYRLDTVRRHLTSALHPYVLDVLFMANVLLEGKLMLVRGTRYHAWMRDNDKTPSSYTDRMFGHKRKADLRQLRNEARIAQHDMILAVHRPRTRTRQFVLRLLSTIHFGTFRYPGADPLFYLTYLPAKLARNFIRIGLKLRSRGN